MNSRALLPAYLAAAFGMTATDQRERPKFGVNPKVDFEKRRHKRKLQKAARKANRK